MRACDSRLAPVPASPYVNAMVNTWEILAEKERSADTAAPEHLHQFLDDELLILDIANTLEFDPKVSRKHLTSETNRREIIQRLEGIYQAQDIDISEEIILSGIAAYEDRKFEITPHKKGASTRLARLYINRRKWLPLFYTLLFIFGSVAAINYVGFVRPQQIENKRVQTLLGKTLPEQLSESHEHAVSIAATDALTARADNLLALGQDAIAAKDIAKAEKLTSELSQFAHDLNQTYQLRIVSRPGEYSGVFRINQDGDREVRNYYLIVEAIGADGEPIEVLINSEEDQAALRTKIWGLRVPESVFNRVAADKADDQIIQNAIIASKSRGHIDPEFSIQTSGGYILDW